MIVIFAKLTAQPGKRDELARGLDAIRVDAESEPGTLVFTVHTARDHDDVVLCYEVYRDEVAIAAHREGKALLALMDVIGDLIAGAPEITYVTAVGAKIDPSVAMPRSIADA